MNTPETSEMKELAELAKTLSAACKKVVAETKTGSHTAPVIMAALVVLTVVKSNTEWR